MASQMSVFQTGVFCASRGEFLSSDTASSNLPLSHSFLSRWERTWGSSSFNPSLLSFSFAASGVKCFERNLGVSFTGGGTTSCSFAFPFCKSWRRSHRGRRGSSARPSSGGARCFCAKFGAVRANDRVCSDVGFERWQMVWRSIRCSNEKVDEKAGVCGELMGRSRVGRD